MSCVSTEGHLGLLRWSLQGNRSSGLGRTGGVLPILLVELRPAFWVVEVEEARAAFLRRGGGLAKGLGNDVVRVLCWYWPTSGGFAARSVGATCR